MFLGIKDFEFSASFETQFVVELLKKMEMSRLHAKHNLEYAQNLFTKYKTRLSKATTEMDLVETKIDAQVAKIDRSEESLVDKARIALKVEIPTLSTKESQVRHTKWKIQTVL